MNKTNERKTPKIKSLEKALCLLDFIGERTTPVSVKEVAEIENLTASSAYKILNTFVDMDYLVFDTNTKTYQLSCKFIRFSGKLRESKGLSPIARPYMMELSNLTNETVHLGIREGFYGVFLDKVNSPQIVGVQTRVGTKAPLDKGATAKVMMAFLDDSRFETFCSNFLKNSEEGEKRIEEARKQREEIRRKGYSVTSEEVNPNVAAVAAPIFGGENKLLGAVAVAGPCQRFTPQKVKTYIPLVIEYAKKISKDLGAEI